MQVEIINVGTELLLGEIVNTNATYLQKMCKELGFDVFHQSVVGDNPQRFVECLEIAFKRGADCVITTGGLGPTQDDLTKELSAEFLGLEMVYSQEEALKVDAKCKFVTGLSEVPKNNFKQAYFPKDCFVLENEVGTANGCVMEKEGKMIINLPGPPKEMCYVVDHVLKPYLERFKKATIYTYEFRTMGIGESVVDVMLNDLISEQDKVSIALYASEEIVRIRLGCKADSLAEAEKAMSDIKKTIHERLASYILPQEDLKESVMKMLPSFRVDYLGDFRFRDDFFLAKGSDDGDLMIQVDRLKESLGDRIVVNLELGKRTRHFSIPLLKKAELSYQKLEAKIVNQLFMFLKGLD